jgi:hypothetical protein
VENYIDFLEKLNELTKTTGVIIDTFDDQYYNPSLTTEAGFGEDDAEGRIFISYDLTNKTYVGRINNPYVGAVVFPNGYVEKN